jgi:hypothetical protein
MKKGRIMPIESDSYMELKLHTDGKDSIMLRVPTFWDAINNQWLGAVQTPKTKIILRATGKDSFELQNNFNITLSKYLSDPQYADEVFSMFK